jgi:hypothetical protein
MKYMKKKDFYGFIKFECIFWTDLTNFFSHLQYHKNLSDIIRNHCMMNGAYNNKPSIDLINKLIDDL